MSEQTKPAPVRASFNPKHLARLMPFKATNDIRYYMNGVCIERAERGVYLIATDARCAEVLSKSDRFCGVVFWQEASDRVIVAQVTKVPELLVLIMPFRDAPTDAVQRELFKPFEARRPTPTSQPKGADSQTDVEEDARVNADAEAVPA